MNYPSLHPRACTIRTRERTQMHSPPRLTIYFTMPPGNGNGSGSVPPGQWTFLFSVLLLRVFLLLRLFLLLLVLLLLLLRLPLPASRLPSFVTLRGSTDALASDTNRYLFVGPLACPSASCTSPSSSVSVSLITPRTRRRSPRAAKALFYWVKSYSWTSFLTLCTYRDLPRFR